MQNSETHINLVDVTLSLSIFPFSRSPAASVLVGWARGASGILGAAHSHENGSTATAGLPELPSGGRSFSVSRFTSVTLSGPSSFVRTDGWSIHPE